MIKKKYTIKIRRKIKSKKHHDIKGTKNHGKQII